MTTFSDLLAIFDERAWTIEYSNMKEGKWGHYMTVGMLTSPVLSYHTFVELEAKTFSELLQKAHILIKEKSS